MHIFAALPRWLFLGILVYAPWAFGCTRPWTIAVLNGLLAAVVLCWLIACVLECRWPRVPAPCLAAIGALLVQGWFMAWNARQFYDTELLRFIPIAAPLAAAPGAIDGPSAREMMVRCSALLGALLFTIDFFQEKVWRRRFAWTVVATGASLIAFGIAQRILAAPMIFWGEDRETRHFFATYFYHGNAGSFINLVLPLIVLWTALVFRGRGRHLAQALCVPAVLITVAGAFVNVSKAAMVLSLALLLVLVLLHLPELWRAAAERGASRVAIGAVLAAVALGVLIFSGGWEKSARRWSKLPAILGDNPRTTAIGVAWKMTADSGWCGFGSGTFALAFPHYTGADGARIPGIWRYLHQDYLQTVIEWGWLGAGAWLVLLFGGAGLAAWHGWKEGAPLSEARPLYLAAALGLGTTALHALVDFPFQIASLQLYIVTFAGLGWSAWFRR